MNWCHVPDLADSAILQLHSHSLRACVVCQTAEFLVDAHLDWLIEAVYNMLELVPRYQWYVAPTDRLTNVLLIHHQHLFPTIDHMEIYSKFLSIFCCIRKELELKCLDLKVLTCMWGQLLHFELRYAQPSISPMDQNYRDRGEGLSVCPSFYAVKEFEFIVWGLYKELGLNNLK